MVTEQTGKIQEDLTAENAEDAEKRVYLLLRSFNHRRSRKSKGKNEMQTT